MPLVAGIDSSTQSTKVVVCDADSGEVVSSGRAPHPDGTEVHPDAWEQALRQPPATARSTASRPCPSAAQQHGMVVLDDAGEVVRPALLWNDTRSAQAAVDLTAELGGPQAWSDAVGLVPVASFTVTKLRWLARAEPDAARRVAQVCLPHDWLTSRLLPGVAARHRPRRRVAAPATGRRATGDYREDLLELALGTVPGVPRVLEPGGTAGTHGGRRASSRPAPATTWPRPSASGSGPATSWSPSARAARSSPCRTPPPPTPPARSPASPTPPAASCRWSRR